MESLPINAFDLIVLVILVLSAGLAFARGFVREVLAIGSWIGAALVTRFAVPHVSPVARDIFDNPTVSDFIGGFGYGSEHRDLMADVAGGVVVFIAAMIAFSILSTIIARMVQGSGLSAVDRSLGLVFGLLRGGLVICLFYLLLVWLIPDRRDRPDWIEEARTRPLVERGTELLLGLLPQDARAAEGDLRSRIREAGPPPPLPGTPEPARPGRSGEGRYDQERLDQLLDRESNR
ncbi:MAG: CvpA family protein [Alphaproteobacteria bacterium]|nr:CvpA family protein [Alphaproteobacteria bacterium]